MNTATTESTSAVNASANTQTSEAEKRDEFGRLESERTIVLTPAQAEAVATEVKVGKHQTFADAFGYQMERGIAEIKRARDSQAKASDAKRLAANAKSWATLLKLNPGLLADPKVMAKYAEDLTPRV